MYILGLCIYVYAYIQAKYVTVTCTGLTTLSVDVNPGGGKKKKVSHLQTNLLKKIDFNIFGDAD